MPEQSQSRLITVAIHTYEKAVALRSLLESEGIEVTLNNVNLEHPAVSSGIRVRIHETDLPLALRIIENHEVFTKPDFSEGALKSHYILVPVDFSDYTINAVRIAAAIASKHKASLTLLNSYIDPYVGGDGVQLTDSLTYDIVDAEARQQIAKTAEKMMENLCRRIREEMKSGDIEAVKFTTEVVEGVPEDAIAAYAKDNPPMMTVMGTRGADKKEKEMIGSVAAEVLDGCRFPVMTIPEPLTDGEIGSIDNILFFCNADQEDILAMDTLMRLFPDMKANVTVVVIPSRRRWIDTNRPQSVNALIDYFKQNYNRLNFESVSVERGNAIDEITKLNATKCFDLIVVPNKKKKNILSRLFNPSLAHKIIFNADIPMLVLPV